MTTLQRFPKSQKQQSKPRLARKAVLSSWMRRPRLGENHLLCVRSSTQKRRKIEMNYSDQIAAFESRRDTNKTALEDIAKAAAEDGATLDAQQKEQKDDLLAEIKEIDDHLKFLRDM